MKVALKPFTSKQTQELEGYIATWVKIVRIAAYAVLVVFTGLIFRGFSQILFTKTSNTLTDIFWVLPTAAFALYIWIRSGKWTGGRQFHDAVKKDIAGGNARVLSVKITDAILIEEQEDDGPSYIILSTEGETVFFSGQYLDRLQAKGFPWSEIEIVEAPESKVFFGIKKKGARINPSVNRMPLEYEEAKSMGAFDNDYQVLNVKFETLKRKAQQNAVEQSSTSLRSKPK
ncbi:MAG: hypothetical protein QM496_11905 [Verrucomicrobiota bacterium]